MGDTINQLAETSKHLATVHKIGRSTDLSDVYKDLQAMLEKWSKHIKNQGKTARDTLEAEQFYGTLEASALKELNQRRATATATYTKHKEHLEKKKARMFKQDPSKWDLHAEWTQ